MSEEQKESGINKLLAGAILSLLSWNIYTTQQLSINMAVLTEKVESLEAKMKG
jgi:hypothetical protein